MAVLLLVLVGTVSYANAALLPLSPQSLVPSLCKFNNGTVIVKCNQLEDTFNLTHGKHVLIHEFPSNKTIWFDANSTVSGINLGTHGFGIEAGNFDSQTLQFLKILCGSGLTCFSNGTNIFINGTVSGGGAGITTLNGDATPAQTISGSGQNITITNSGSNHIINLGSNIPKTFTYPLSYTVYKNGTKFYALNGTTGRIDQSGTDAYTVAQYALDHLNLGGRVMIKHGQYILSNYLNIHNGTYLEGEAMSNGNLAALNGAYDTVLVPSGNFPGIVINNARGVTVTDIQVNGNHANSAVVSGSNAINVTNSLLVFFDRVSSLQSKDNGIFVNNTLTFMFHDLDVKTANNRGIYVLGCSDFDIALGNIGNNAGAGIEVSGGGDGEITQVDSYLNDIGFYLHNTLAMRLVNDRPNTNQHNGIEIFKSVSSLFTGSYNLVANNLVIQNAQFAKNDAAILVAGNTPTQNTINNIITGNMIFDNQGIVTQFIGIQEGTNTDYNVITNNNINNTLPGDAVIRHGTHSIIENNVGNNDFGVNTFANIGHGTGSFGFISSISNALISSKNITAGSGISLSGNSTDITVSSTVSSGISTSQNVGKGTGSSGVLASPTSTTIKGKNMTAGSGISISNNSTDITISNTGVLSALLTTMNIGHGTGSFGFLSSPTTTIVKSKNMTAGKNIILTGNTTDITINATNTAQGNNLTSTNGAGFGIFENRKNSTMLNFRTIVSNPSLTVSTNATNLLINDTGTNADVTFYHRGGGKSWYSAVSYQSASETSSTLPSGNFTYAYPFIVGRGFSIDRIQFDSLGGVAGRCIAGLYNDTGSIYPSSLIVTGTDQSTSGVGVKTDTVSANLKSNNLYWFAFNCNGALATMGSYSTTIPNVLGYSGTTGAGQQIEAIRFAANNPTSGYSLPSTFPAGAADQLNQPYLAIWVRAK